MYKRKESKYNNKDIHQVIREDLKKTKTRKNLNDKKYISINNYFIYKWTKYSNQKTE